MNRREKLIAELNLSDMVGAEIGPLNHPLVKKEESKVFYIDHAGTESLKNKYANDPNVDTAQIADVDAIWGASTLQECLGSGIKLDYVIASHVIEHVPDLLTWLQEIKTVLKPEGEVRLAVPDRRFTFDYLRRESRLCDVLDAYLRRARVPLPVAILDHIANTRVVDVVKAWAGDLDESQLQPMEWKPRELSYELLTAHAKDALENDAYRDVHCWIFTPHSFAGLLAEMSALGLHDFACARYFDTPVNENEFLVWLRTCNDREETIKSWRRMQDTARTVPLPPLKRHVLGAPARVKLFARELLRRKAERDRVEIT
ncbi:MAG TPA: methyltransferase domain-containing protein [Bryobacteraceae bacterium]|nr:methyltransferase domain-containing protein [Bryobacteraceae bacterium]